MRKIYILLVFALFTNKSFSQQSKYEQWLESTKGEINMLPEYGNKEKSAQEVKADEEFINTVIGQDKTREKGSDHLVQLGFTYLYRGDLRTAMSRFNQGWLLNPKNENAYWGFGSVYFYLGEQKLALEQLEKGLSINPNSSNILTDIATIKFAGYTQNHREADREKAIELFNKSYSIDPENQNTLFKLSSVYLYIGDCANAKKYYDKCMELGGRPVTKEFTVAIKQQCNIK